MLQCFNNVRACVRAVVQNLCRSWSTRSPRFSARTSRSTAAWSFLFAGRTRSDLCASQSTGATLGTRLDRSSQFKSESDGVADEERMYTTRTSEDLPGGKRKALAGKQCADAE